MLETNEMLDQDIMREATRLTRAGQLVEATALLQRMLRGENAPEAPSRAGRIALVGREPPTIDVKANTIEQTDNPHPERAAPAPPRMLRQMLDPAKARAKLRGAGFVGAPIKTTRA